MASFTERIRLIFDVDGKGAKRGFADFGKDVREAEGFFGKAKAGAASLASTVKDNMGAAAIAGGAALVAFGVKAVSAFTDTAKAAIDLGKATGLTTEQASRFIAIGDDVNVSADALTAGLGRVAKTLDADSWKKYGIATRDASGHARSTNEILLDTFDKLSKITNGTERAKVGNELFGKGYANLAPLIGKSRQEMEKWLGSVEDGQVITDSEGKSAEKMRRAMDDLSDAVGELSLSFGGLLSSLSPVFKVFAKGIGVFATGINTIKEGAGKVVDWLNPWHEEQKKVTAATEDTTAATQDMTTAMEDAAKAAEEQKRKLDELYSSVDDLVGQSHDAKRAQDDWTQALQDLSTAVDDPKTAVNEYAQAVENTAQQAWDTSKALAELQGKQALANGEQWDAVDSAKEQKKKLEELAATLDPNSDLYKQLQGYIALLNSIPGVNLPTVRWNGMTVPASTVNPNAPENYGVLPRGWAMVDGKPTPPPDSAIGKYVRPRTDGVPVTSSTPQPGDSRTVHVTNNIYVNGIATADTGRQVANALQAYYRSGGAVVSGPR